MAKEINEKTFELNITNELLNLSKSFIWYLDHIHWFPFPIIRNEENLRQFFNHAMIFAEGLTQKEENNPITGGYDVSVSYNLTNGLTGRLLFLQYKAGIRRSYSNNKESKFYRQTARNERRSPEHALFTFNDAANGAQHSTLRNLANSAGISPNSVIYVFPRITEKSDFKSKVGSLIQHTSFVPVLEIDSQAANQTPPITINNGITHKFRTSYDGLTSEVNFFFFFFLYNNKFVYEILAELICIQIERFARIIDKEGRGFLEVFQDILPDALSRFVRYELKQNPSSFIVSKNVSSYIKQMAESFKSNKIIPQAPSKYTTILTSEGMKIRFEDKNDLSLLSYQIF
ncbi:hypothetical protein MASR2M69_00270 [Bacteroidota bacterium]